VLGSLRTYRASIGVAIVLATTASKSPAAPAKYRSPTYSASVVCDWDQIVGKPVPGKGKLVVSVVDLSGEPLLGASVKVTNGSRSVEAKSSSCGHVMIPDLVDGTYEVTVQLLAFRRATATGLPVSRSCTSAITVPLAVASVGE